MNKKKNEKSEFQSQSRWVKNYEEISDGTWTRWINSAKELVKGRPPCYDYCPKNSDCPKLSDYKKKLEELREVMKPRLDRNVKDARKEIFQLLREGRRLRGDICRCIHVRKRLTYDKGYRMWYSLYD